MAAHDDCQSEEAGLREGTEIDACQIDGAIFHAEEAVQRLKLLRDAMTDNLAGEAERAAVEKMAEEVGEAE